VLDKNAAMKIPMPAGFQAPKGIEPGVAFDAVASMEICEDGSLEILSIDGAPLKGGKDEESESEAETPAKAAAESREGPMRPMSAKGISTPWDQ